MAEIPISQLPVALSLSGTEQVPVVQGGVTKRVSALLMASLAPGAMGPGGSNGQIQYNNGANQFAGSLNLNWSSPTLTIGQQQIVQGQLAFANTAAGSYITTIQGSNSATAAWTLTLPVAAGSSGQLLSTNGSGVTSWVNNTSAPGGSNTQVQFNNSGAFGGSANLTWSSPTLSIGAAGVTGALAILGSTSGTATIVAPATAGTPTLTLPSTTGTFALTSVATLSSLTSIGTIGTGVWQGTAVALAYGGTNANLTASNGGIFYSTATAGAILSGTATANQMLLSGASGAPSWSTVTHPATTTINQILYSSAANVISGLATTNGGILNASSAGVPSLTITPTLGVQQTSQGQLILANTAAGAYATTIQSSNSASAAWTLTLPTTAGTNTYVLQTNGSGVTSWVSSTVILTVGSTATSGGSAGQIMFDTGSALNESANLLFASNVLTVGLAGSASGTLAIPNATSGTSYLTAPAAATFQFGQADAASPVAQNIRFQNTSVGTSNVAGALATINLSAGTGTGAGGALAIYGAVTGTTGSTQNTRVRTLDLTPGASSSAGGKLALYNTYTDSNNGEWLSIDWSTSANVASIITNKNGTGTQRALSLGASGAANWQINTSGHFVPASDATYDIGTSSVSVRNFYTDLAIIQNGIRFGTGTGTLARIIPQADGIITLFNSASTGFTRLQFGGTTSSFPSLKVSSAALQARLADDSAFTSISASDFYSNDASFVLRSSTTITGGGTANAPTLTSGPVTGNPTKWLPYDDNGTTRYIPAW